MARHSDFLFTPPGVVGDAVNGGTVPAVFLAVRSEPTALKNLAMRPELDGIIP